jgi:hypothetical protein
MEKSFVKEIINDFPGTNVSSILCSIVLSLEKSSRSDEPKAFR